MNVHTFLVIGLAAGFLLPADAQDAPKRNPMQEDWLFKSNNSSTTTSVQTVAPPLTGGAAKEVVNTTYSHQVGDLALLKLESNDQQPDFGLAADGWPGYGGQLIYQQDQRASLTERPFPNWVVTESFCESQQTDETRGSTGISTQTTVGASASTEVSHIPPLDTSLKLNEELNLLQPSSSTSQQTDTMGLELRQPISDLPVAAVITGKYSDTTDPADHDFLQGQSPSMEQALEWKAKDDTLVKLGFREMGYANMQALTTQKSQGMFAHLSQNLLPDFAWNSDVEFSRSRQDTLLPETPEGGDPTSLAGTVVPPTATITPFQEESMWLKMGPSFKLPNDISASLEFSNKWDTNITPGMKSGSEQRVSMSFKGTF